MSTEVTRITAAETIVGPKLGPKPIKKVAGKSVGQCSSQNTLTDLSEGIEKSGRIVVRIRKKLLDMSGVLGQISDEKDDIIREQLARYFNVLKAYIEEALRSTGDRWANEILSGRNIQVNTENGGASVVVRDETVNINSLVIPELSKSPTDSDLETAQQNINEAQVALNKLSINLAAVRATVAHYTKASTALVL